MKPLADKCPMPFGKFRDRPMEDVPGHYLDWLHGQSWIDQWPAVLDYIKRHRKYIDDELERQERAREEWDKHLERGRREAQRKFDRKYGRAS